MKFILLFIISSLFIIAENFFCQQAATANIPYLEDEADTLKNGVSANDDYFPVNVRTIDESRFEKYKNDPDFNYRLNKKQSDDWITKLKNWIQQQLGSLTTSKSFAVLFDYVYYALAVLALLIIIRGFIKADRSGIFFGKISRNNLKLTNIREDIDKLDFEELISSAIDSRQYKLAVRYLFLKSLKLLSDKKIIEVKNHKTNSQYLFEIKDKKIANSFKNAVRRFEWIWYGDFPVDDMIMKASKHEFNNLFKLITE